MSKKTTKNKNDPIVGKKNTFRLNYTAPSEEFVYRVSVGVDLCACVIAHEHRMESKIGKQDLFLYFNGIEKAFFSGVSYFVREPNGKDKEDADEDHA
jgi:hypothetical protein